MKKRILAALLALGCALLVFTGCGSKKDNANAIGGNVKASIADGNISIDFNIYSIYSLGNASMTGHFGGKVTIVE